MKYGRVYLSIDCDYWTGMYAKAYKVKSMRAVLGNIKKANVPLIWVRSHESILDHVNWFDHDTLINMDYHSDLTDGFPANDTNKHEFSISLNCGTWANHVRQDIRNNGHFIWVYPAKRCPDKEEGYVHAGVMPFGRRSMQVCGWRWATERYRYIPDIVWPAVVAVGICASPEFCDDHEDELFVRIAKDMGVKLRTPTAPGWQRSAVFPPQVNTGTKAVITR